jgi:CheY-like chemotaxis protein
VEERAPQLLVIEDAQDQAILVGVAARRALPGLEVHIAEDGQQGIDFLSGVEGLATPAKHPVPDLIILDLLMPVVDGFGVLQWIQDHMGELLVPVVVLTGSPDPEHEARARALGAADVFEKPKQLDGLGTTVKQIVTRWISAGDIMAAHLRLSG